MRKLTACLLNEVMQLEAAKQIQAGPYERTGKRRAHRNGTRPRSLKTIHGEVVLDKPQIREFPFKTKVFQRYSRVEEAVRVAVAESYLEGVSTRKVEKVFSGFGLNNISASEVSRIAKKLDNLVKDFLERPIEESIPYLFVDASYFKVRTDGRYINKALLVVTAIREDGCREILSAMVADSEDQTARGHPTLKDGVCFGPRALVSRISETSELRFPGSDHQNNCVSAFDCMIALLINLKKT